MNRCWLLHLATLAPPPRVHSAVYAPGAVRILVLQAAQRVAELV